MASKIEWTDETWNPVVGCSVVSPACANCYAMAQAARIERMQPGGHYAGTTQIVNGKPVWTGVLKQAPEHILLHPMRWKRPRRIFVNSMSDLFHENVPDEWIDRVFAVMALAPQHTFQCLTKRPERMREYCSDRATPRRVYEAACDIAVDLNINVVLIAPGVDQHYAPPGPRVFLDTWPLPGVWLGVTAEDQARADERIPLLLATPAAKRFVSVEPMLSEIDLRRIVRPRGGHRDTLDALTGEWTASESGCVVAEHDGLDWIIGGCESGPNRRPMALEWIRDLRDDCRDAGVPFFMKQMEIDGKVTSDMALLPGDLRVQEFPA